MHQEQSYINSIDAIDEIAEVVSGQTQCGMVLQDQVLRSEPAGEPHDEIGDGRSRDGIRQYSERSVEELREGLRLMRLALPTLPDSERGMRDNQMADITKVMKGKMP